MPDDRQMRVESATHVKRRQSGMSIHSESSEELDEMSRFSEVDAATTENLRSDWKEEMRSELKAVFTRALLKPVVELPPMARRQSRRFSSYKGHHGQHRLRRRCGRLHGEGWLQMVDRVAPLVNPVSAFRLGWLLVVAVAILTTAFAAPYRIGFLPGPAAVF